MKSWRLAPAVVALTILTAVPAAAETPAETSNDGLEYTYRYPLQVETVGDPFQLTSFVGDEFVSYFPFDSDCKTLPPVGTRCELYTVPGWPIPGTTNPVEVVHRSPNSWTFLSLPGHAEGADRYITFTFDQDPDFSMTVHAWGPWTPTAALTVSTGAAEAIWGRFASNVSRGF